VQTHDGKTQNWDAIAAFVPGRTLSQCCSRWYDAFDPRNVRTTARKGKWTPDEDDKLKDAVRMHGVRKDWEAIARLVPGRTEIQCRNRWREYLEPSRSTVREEEHGALNKAPDVGQDRPFS
jgi:myb proto-oncogene protein